MNKSINKKPTLKVPVVVNVVLCTKPTFPTFLFVFLNRTLLNVQHSVSSVSVH